MERLAMETANLTDKNIDKILELFPNVATEAEDENGKLKRAIDFDKLRQELSEHVIDGEESYDFTWVGKREAMIEANRPIKKTLRPDKDSSVNWDTTENIYIEGDNLDALKLLQESYLGKVKMIYIDPPYNTGKDFVYRDNFTQDKDSYEEELGTTDEDGNRLFQNTETNGRFHSDWCSMIYSRLKLAKNLLAKDGVIFISIDDNEVRNLKNICDEIFGEETFHGMLTWIKKTKPVNMGSAQYSIQSNIEYILVYSRKKQEEYNYNLPVLEHKNYPFEENGEKYRIESVDQRKNIGSMTRPSMVYTVLGISPKEGYRWQLSPQKRDQLLKENKLFIKNNKLFIKIFENEEINCCKLEPFWSHRADTDTAEIAKEELEQLMSCDDIFDTVKPYELIKQLCMFATNKDSLILDFFSGSATTAHSIIQLNANDEGKRKFIMVQLPAQIDRNGYKTICEIGKERIRRAGKKIQEDNPDKKIDIGFRVFKVDDTNMKDVYYSPKEYKQSQLNMFESNIKDDRTDEDLLYGVLLDWGVELSLPHKIEIIDGKRIHIINAQPSFSPDLVACFENQITENVVQKIASLKPTRAVFKDGSFNSAAHKINVEEIFKLMSPDTTVKVI